MTSPAYNDPTWHQIANCDHAAFNQADSPQRPLEQCPSCHVFLRTITTAEGWAEHRAEQRRDDLRLRDVDYDRAADDYYEKIPMKTTDLLALDLEYRLTIAHRINSDCDCVRYFISRREVLIPEVVKHAESIGADPVDEFARYARGVHARHESGLSLDVA